ncbi:hypothetical protein GCM10027275_10000 [Rhabdobacter roseus]
MLRWLTQYPLSRSLDKGRIGRRIGPFVSRDEWGVGQLLRLGGTEGMLRAWFRLAAGASPRAFKRLTPKSNPFLAGFTDGSIPLQD